MELWRNLKIGEIGLWMNFTSFDLNEIQRINKTNCKTPLAATDTDIDKGHQEPSKHSKLDWNEIMKSGRVRAPAADLRSNILS